MDGVSSQNEYIGDNSRRFVFACAVFVSLNSILLGYDVGVMSGAIIFIQEDLEISEFQEEILVGILSIVSLLGSLAGGKMSDSKGRKWTIAFAAILFQCGAALMSIAPSFRVLFLGRIIAGIGIGFGIMIAPIYIAEISPASARGSLTSFPEIFVNFGILLGYISNYAFSGLPAHINWRVMLGIGVLPSVFIGFALCVIPESPRWLVAQNRIEEARLVLFKINATTREADEKLAEIQADSAGNCESKSAWQEILNPGRPVKKMLIAGVGITVFQQITGIDATVYYSPTILKNAGIESKAQLLAATVAVGFTKTVFILVAIALIDKLGRKPLLYVSTVGMTLSLFCLSFSLSFSLGIGFAIFAVCANVAFFSIGIGPVCWVILSEVFPLRLRAQGSAIGAVGNRLASGLISMSFLSMSQAISVGGTFFIYFLVSVCSIFFVWNCIPETKGKLLEEIESIFGNDVGEIKSREVELENAELLSRNEI